MGKNVNITVDAGTVIGPQDHYWRYIGYDECNYTYIKEGKELLKKFADLEKDPYYVRTHFTFCTGNCHHTYKFGSTNIYWENEKGEPVYDFTYYDMIIDAQLESGNKPFIELGFMPLDLIDRAYTADLKGDIYGRYKDSWWACPPKSYKKWYDFIYTVVSHLVERHGEEEVATWYFELWNEPDIFYWAGTAAEYTKMFDYTEAALHKAAPTARLSGPAVTGIRNDNDSTMYMRYFLDHCKNGMNFCTGKQGTRLDFITCHTKGGGFPFEMHAPKCVPSVESQVNQVKNALEIMKEFGYLGTELVLSEADPDGWAAGGIYDNANMCFRNTEYYASYVASGYEKMERLSAMYNTPVKPLAWAFMFPGERCFEGTRTFSTQSINKAVFNMFKIYGMLGFEKLGFTSDAAEDMSFLQAPDIDHRDNRHYTGEGEETDVAGFAVRGENGETQIVVYSHNNDRDLHETADITLKITGLASADVTATHYRIDDQHSNAYAEWVRQGQPLFPEGEVYDAIKARDGLEKLADDAVSTVKDGAVTLTFSMPTHGVSLIIIK